ncbi:MAG: dihydroorotate dehydrogenase [Rubrobacter sp.]|nr:dihydroorotate dehydrogenase [Rubrobacter sp.]
MVADLRVELCGIPLRTPLIPAAGTLSRETLGEAADAYGAVLPKTVTPGPRRGNPPPRVAEVASGMVNSIGLQNPGLEGFLRELGGYEVGLPVFVSVAGDTVEEFSGLCARLASEPRVSAVELNLSCPNVEHGGLTFCAGPESVERVVAACRAALPGTPLFAKLASEGVRENSLAAEGTGADALTLVNTIPALTVDPHRREVFLKGGLSGPAIKPVALRSVYEVARLVEVPVIGCGGIASGTDVAEFMLAGAAAVQVGSSSFVREPGDILSELSGYLQGAGLSAAALTGSLRDRERVV